MEPPRQEDLKREVRDFWNAQSCDTQVAGAERFTREYFEEIEAFRYFDQPFIHSFAQFTRYHGRKVLEVGFGAGTDFTQWVRAGAVVSGIDLTPEALENVTHRIRAYNLPQPTSLQVGDAENLPFPSDHFDLGYSFGVLHHSPDTECALSELVRVVRPGGHIKVMLYNRHSTYVFSQWFKQALLKGRPWKSLRSVLWNHVESTGTKGYTRAELLGILGRLPLSQIHIHTEMTAADYLAASAFPPLNWCFKLLLRAAGCRQGWHPSHYVARVNDPATHRSGEWATRQLPDPLLTGNRLGFFHCISARKTGV